MRKKNPSDAILGLTQSMSRVKKGGGSARIRLIRSDTGTKHREKDLKCRRGEEKRSSTVASDFGFWDPYLLFWR